MRAQRTVAGVLVLLIAVGSGIWFGGRPAEPPPLVMSTARVGTADMPPAAITVHVSGEVARPGLVDLSSDARVADALAAAGGVLPGADLGALNLAAPVADGSMIVVPRRGATPTNSPGGDGRVEVNRAGVDEMAALPGIGPVLAQRIVDHREEHGPFGSVDDLLDVPGIGEAKLAMLRDAVIIP